MYKAILFDLDGTLTDSGEGVKKAFMYALERFGIHEKFENLDKVMGPPLYNSFREFYGLSHDDANLAIKYYREYYSDKGVFENRLYDGIDKLLQKLKDSGKCVMIATSKPDFYAVPVLKMFNIYDYFDFISAATLDGTLSKKSDIVKIAIEKCACDKKNILMVGDRHHDIDGARENGVDSVGVLYGYGIREEMELAGAAYICDTVSDLEKFILENQV